MAGAFPTTPGGFLPPGFTSPSSGDPRTFFTSTTTTSSTPAAPVTSSQTSPSSSISISYSPSPVNSTTSATPTGDAAKDHDDDDFSNGLDGGPKAAIGLSVSIGVIIIIALSVWYCCGCCGLRARRKKRREGMRAPDINTQRPVPLNTINASQAPPPEGDAPPQYEEAVPPQHQHIAGGARHIQRVEEDEAVISDGKTPLSEIPFEDVVLDHSPSEGSSRSFSERHHGIGGDTTGHTNT